MEATVPKKITVEEASNLDREGFIERFGSLYERSPWVAEGAWRERPFADLSEMHAAFVTTVRDAPPERRLGLIRAHPDLAGKAAVAGELTPESTREQASAGLDRLSPEEYEAFTRLNDAYKEKFGFPMIFAVKENTKETILSGVEARLGNSRPQELEAALGEITKIGFFRLQELVRPESQEATGGRGVGEP
jgi:2-oxo-4-hydroxy-4-carboxy-5-ureidoimidazoline decarboxylase